MSLAFVNPYQSPPADSLEPADASDEHGLDLAWAARGLDLLLGGWIAIVASAGGALLVAGLGDEGAAALLGYAAVAALLVGTGFQLAGGLCFVAARESTAFRGWGFGCGLGFVGMAGILLSDFIPLCSGEYGLALGNTLLVAGCLAQASILRRVATILGESTLAALSVTLLWLWSATFLVAFARLFAAGPLADLPLLGATTRGLAGPFEQLLALFVFLGFLLGLIGTIAVTYFVRTELHQHTRRTVAEAEIPP